MSTQGDLFVLFGPPGTGKTTEIQRQIHRAADKYDASEILVTAFTTTAAHEATQSRDGQAKLPLTDKQVGTLHAHCFAMLGKPIIAESKVEEFNAAYPAHMLSKTVRSSKTLDEPTTNDAGDPSSDAAFMEYGRYRAMMRPRELWKPSVVSFARAWEKWKSDTGYLDFTDLIDKCRLDKYAHMPYGCDMLFVDEAQDLTPNQHALVKAWSQMARFTILAGDDDQTIFQHVGATPDPLIDVLEANKRVLHQSQRVPRAVQTLAETWIHGVARRQEKVYNPRRADPHDPTSAIVEGAVRTLPARINNPRIAIDDAEKQIAAGKSVLFLTSCGYMLHPIIEELRKRGMPFWNPNRLIQKAWNPMISREWDIPAARRGVSTADRVLSFLRMDYGTYGDEARMWNGAELKLWADLVKTEGVFHHGAKSMLDEIPDNQEITGELQLALFHEAALDRIFECDLDWLAAHLTTAKAKAAELPIAIARAKGGAVLRARPQIVVGTIHSLKGGQADVVYLFPDLSLAGMQEWVQRGSVGHDSIVRAFYVGMTRAKEELVICAPSNKYAVTLPVYAAQQAAA